MKILISDYRASMMPSHDYEIQVLRKGLPDAEIEVYEYSDEKRAEFYEKLQNTNALLTAFIRMDREALEHAPNLQVISINATGYDCVDLPEATKRSIGVCPVGEYCTWDVAEHTIALMLALNKNLKEYTYDIEKKHVWEYSISNIPTRILNQTLGIFGFGKIGKAVAKMARGLGMQVIAMDIADKKEEAEKLGVEMVAAEEIYERADVISNHMNLGAGNRDYFTIREFRRMKRHPIFLNMARGVSINEEDLAQALDEGILRGAGLDVLSDETPKLEGHPLVNRRNLIITHHAAFFSKEAFEDMQRISCENIVHFVKGEKENVFRLVNEV
ncbi:C-terminal binding protein [Schaedlerella arabinosiphila]|uniref:C-terminal binding protein n=1 Tax=Schaedlerella arabinosiphila TaxID=2044587 RepID=A0A9X5CCW0_9FIRM|nr:NAD(P)-dependent oxidoreductase [Schaedlerella arabinosiphila]NDO70968.1 C-terminal binding protein [Schaedlerella arabinosiphila]